MVGRSSDAQTSLAWFAEEAIDAGNSTVVSTFAQHGATD